MRGEERAEVLLAGLVEDGQVAAVDHVHAERARREHEHAELRFSSGAPPVMSSVVTPRCLEEREDLSDGLAVIVSVRVGPALTWQCRQVWLHL